MYKYYLRQSIFYSRYIIIKTRIHIVTYLLSQIVIIILSNNHMYKIINNNLYNEEHI